MTTRISLTRRDAMKMAAAIALPAPAICAAEATSPSPASTMTVGMATTGFTDCSNRQLAEMLSGDGVHTVQLFLTQSDSRYWKYNGRSDVSSLTGGRCREIAAAYRDAGIAIHSIGVYTNLIHPDASERKANLTYFEEMIKIGAAMGVRTFITEAGHYLDPKAPAPAVPLEFQDAVWPRMVATARELALLAEKYDAKVLFESFYRGFLASAKRTRLFHEEVGSQRIRALLDVANLQELNDLEEMFQQLGPWIDCLHAKDRKLHVDRGVAAGKGDLDYPRFVALAAKFTPHAPLILEYVGSADYREALAHLRSVLQHAGIRPC